MNVQYFYSTGSVNKTLRCSCLLLLISLFSVKFAVAEENHQYTLTFSDSLKYATVETCFANASPLRLEPYHHAIVKNISSAILVAGNQQSRLRVTNKGILLPSVSAGDWFVIG